MKIPLATIESPPKYEFSFLCIAQTIIQERVMKVKESFVKYVIINNDLSKRLVAKFLIKENHGIYIPEAKY